MDSTYSQIIPEYDINKESEGSNGQEMIPIGRDFDVHMYFWFHTPWSQNGKRSDHQALCKRNESYKDMERSGDNEIG